MSIDGKYLLAYDCNNYHSPTPMELDIEYLENNYGGKCIIINEYLIYFDKQKYTLCEEDFDKLNADQIFENIDGDPWHFIRGIFFNERTEIFSKFTKTDRLVQKLECIAARLENITGI